MRPYEIMVILDPTLDERTVAPSLETFLNVVRKDGGSVARSTSGPAPAGIRDRQACRRHLCGDRSQSRPATVSELDRQLSLNESVLRTKVMRTDKH